MVAEGGTRATGQDGRGGPFERRLRRPPDAVDAAVGAVKPAAASDCIVVDAERDQFLAGDVVVVAVRDPEDR